MTAIPESSPAAPLAPLDRELADRPRNDLGNAERLIARHGPDMIFVDGAGWHVWDGRRFEPPFDDHWPEAVKRAHLTAVAIGEEAKALRDELLPPLRAKLKALEDDGLEDDDPRIIKAARAISAAESRVSTHAKYGVSCGNGGKINAMLAQAQPYQRRKPDELDRHPWLLNLRNGTLDLKRFDLRPHHRADLLTKVAAADYDPEADCPRWRKFIQDCHPGEERAETRRFLQVSGGYWLTGDTSEQRMWLHHGAGGNGKSVFFFCLAAVGGDYAATVPIETFLADDRRRGGDATPELIDLLGARLALASEPEKGARLGEAVVKRVTGGEGMKARRLFEGMFNFAPTFKLAISANDKPRIRGRDHGIWRRVLLVPWEVTFSGSRNFKAICDELLEERSGILNWLLDGLRLYQEDKGLKIPDAVTVATATYRAEQDPIGEFVRDRCDTGDNISDEATPLYQAYLQWCADMAIDAIKQTAFGRALSDAGFTAEKVGGKGYRRGLARKIDAKLAPLPSANRGGLDV